jgi:ABC-2 type transport system ATP-binding protein
MMTTLVPLTGGRVLVAGHDVARDPDRARLAIGVIPQAMTSDVDLSVEENLSIYAKLYGVPRDARRKAIAELLELVSLSDRRKSLVGTLSGGMRRRAEIARGLVHSPEILFLDEPTTGLDPVSRAEVWELLSALRRERKLTVRFPTGQTARGRVISKGVEAEFATQRDVSASKRDIRAVAFRVAFANPRRAIVPGMTAEVVLPTRDRP